MEVRGHGHRCLDETLLFESSAQQLCMRSCCFLTLRYAIHAHAPQDFELMVAVDTAVEGAKWDGLAATSCEKVPRGPASGAGRAEGFLSYGPFYELHVQGLRMPVPAATGPRLSGPLGLRTARFWAGQLLV